MKKRRRKAITPEVPQKTAAGEPESSQAEDVGGDPLLVDGNWGRKRVYEVVFDDGDVRWARLVGKVAFMVTGSGYKAGRLWTKREEEAMMQRRRAMPQEELASIAMSLGRSTQATIHRYRSGPGTAVELPLCTNADQCVNPTFWPFQMSEHCCPLGGTARCGPAGRVATELALGKKARRREGAQRANETRKRRRFEQLTATLPDHAACAAGSGEGGAEAAVGAAASGKGGTEAAVATTAPRLQQEAARVGPRLQARQGAARVRSRPQTRRLAARVGPRLQALQGAAPRQEALQRVATTALRLHALQEAARVGAEVAGASALQPAVALVQD
ncbi:hypothetical protein CYMTET_26519 [Cymbomonas tetramitiformis]|uniref:Uncharacterized protein n=1 Tax=Cymbomonas tetramitiformis TaxID=36881 RepID=A0AAE0FRW4_9CHLO|nr:hypothetical protein CYMTET_34145 [Cymbomonas tetramitiformis]KAK3264760.1 hypothetical protein CYMTET_26519 [Cymbomonas tetramitiformis]